MSKIYPFKFLDAYGKEDSHLFFGRDEEIDLLYQMIFRSNILLVYGASGTGKTSLIQCGLASRFQAHDWLSLFVRRGNDLNASLDKILADASGNAGIYEGTRKKKYLNNEDEDDEITVAEQLSPLATSFNAIYLSSFRPIYLIFDQFEELFILGTKQEQIKFTETVQEILLLHQPVKMIFSIREEYLGHLYEFEKAVPQLMRNKLRVEPMNLDKVHQVLVGVTSLKDANISIKTGEESLVTEGIFSKIKGKDKSLTIQLPYLQVFLDKLYLETTHDYSRQADAVFTHETITRMGDIGDVLSDFLENQVKAASKTLSTPAKKVSADDIWQILSPFATLEGTKEPTTIGALRERLPGIAEKLVTDTVNVFVNSRILRQAEDGGIYELAHDALAAKIAGKRTDEEIALLEVKKLITSQLHMNKDAREPFTEKQLNFIEPYLGMLTLTEEEQILISTSQKEVHAKKQKRIRQFRYTVYAMIVVVFVVSGLAVWAINARSNALAARHMALQEKTAGLSLILSGQAHIRQYRYGDPTFGFRFAQYAYLRDTNNNDARRAIYAAIYKPWENPDKYFRKYSIWHNEYVYSAVLSPDGKKILTACQDSTARLWDINTGKEIQTFRSGDHVVSAVFSPDGSKIVSASKDNTARVWDAATGKEMVAFNQHHAILTYAAFSPDGQNVASAAEDGVARIWNASTGEELYVLKNHRRAIKKIAFAKDGRKLLTIGEDTTVTIWDIASGKIMHTLTGHQGNIASAEFSNDSRSIVTASRDYTARIWDALTGRELKKLTGHIYFVNTAVFSKDDKQVLTASGDKTAKIWDVATGQEITTFTGHIGGVNTAKFSHDQTKVVTASVDHVSKIWTIDGKELASLSGHTSPILDAYFTRDDSAIITASFDYSEKLWVASTGKELFKIMGEPSKAPPVPRPVQQDIFSPDSKKILTIPHNNTVIVWDAVHYQPLDTLQGHHGAVASAVFAHSGKTILTASTDKTAMIWDTATGKPLASLTGHSGTVLSAFFSPDDTKIVTRSTDNTVCIWDAASGTRLHELSGHSDYITSAVFSPDGTKIATASKDNTTRIWDAATGTQLKTFTARDVVYSAVFSPDNLTVLTATGDNNAYIWDILTGKAITLRGHGAPVVSAAFSYNGKKVVTASRDNTAKIWDPTTGIELVELSEHIGNVHTAHFSARATTVITSSGDNTVRLWNTETGKEMATLLGSTGYVYAATMSPDGTHVAGVSDDHTTKIWLISIPMIIDYMDRRIEDLYEEDKKKYNIIPDDSKK